MTITVDLNEGRFVDEIGCLNCREVVRARIGMSAPVRMYVASLDCDECGDELVAFDIFTKEAA